MAESPDGADPADPTNAEDRNAEDRTAGARPAAQAGAPRQPIVKQPGRVRRAKLLPAPDTDPSPDPAVEREDGGVASLGSVRGENDDRLRQDRPPHW